MQSLFSRLPPIWKELDIKATRVVDGKGELERFLNTADVGFQKVEDLIWEFLRSHNSQKIRDRFIPLFIEFVGHRWKDYKSRQWNRNRIEVDVTRASYKGSTLAIEDLAREHGAVYCQVVDMASKVLVESKQGTYGDDDSWYFDSDYYHPGVFQVFLSDDVDIEEFISDFQYIKPAGTKWYYRILIQDSFVPIEMVVGDNLPEALLDAGNNTYGTRFTDPINGTIEYFDWVPQVAYDLQNVVESVSAVANAYITIDSMTFFISDPDLTLQDTILTIEQNSRQPAVEPEWGT